MAASLQSHQFNPNIPTTNDEKPDESHQTHQEYGENHGIQKTYKNYNEMLKTLPSEKGWISEHLIHFHGFWLMPASALKGALLIQDHFHARPQDIFMASFPKTGTAFVWLRALIFATMNRARRCDFSGEYPLLSTAPHDCFPFLDSYIYETNSISDIDLLPSPRLFSTHFPYALFPTSLTDSGCRFVYICRNPKDVFVCNWRLMSKQRPKDLPPILLEEAFELFCRGISHYGPFWDHLLEYWKVRLDFPEKILFLKYEDMKREPAAYVKKLAEFMGQPFSVEEENEGVVEEIVRICSFEDLRNLGVDQSSDQRFSAQFLIDYSEAIRRGEEREWENYLTDEMIERLDQITEEKLCGSGLNLLA